MMDFDELVRREAAGQVLLGVDRAFARRFYTDVPLREIEAKTGEAPYFEKAVVFLALVGGPITLFGSLILSTWALGWWSALFIPIAAVIWVGAHGDSARATARLRTISVIFAICGFGFTMSDGLARTRWGMALTFAAAVWLSRLLYASATSFLRGFVLRNRRAWEWLHEQLVVRQVQ